MMAPLTTASALVREFVMWHGHGAHPHLVDFFYNFPKLGKTDSTHRVDTSRDHSSAASVFRLTRSPPPMKERKQASLQRSH